MNKIESVKFVTYIDNCYGNVLNEDVKIFMIDELIKFVENRKNSTYKEEVILKMMLEQMQKSFKKYYPLCFLSLTTAYYDARKG